MSGNNKSFSLTRLSLGMAGGASKSGFLSATACTAWILPLVVCAAVLQAATGGAQPVTKAASGFGHSLFLKSDGSLWATGDNDAGQLGDGTYTSTNRPERIVASGVAAIAAGAGHSLFLKNDGSLWAMGDNSYGALGDGTYNNTNRPEQIVASDVTAIAAGGFHSLFVKSDGSLWVMGNNFWGQLGDGTFSYGTNLPEQVVASDVMAIAGGSWHSLFLKKGGSLWAMGYNYDGELGDGTAIGYPGSTNRPERIVANDVTAIATKGQHSLFLKDDGSLWAMGNNQFGQLGDGTFSYGTNLPEQIVASGVTTIAAGHGHSLFLKNDGSLWAMGNNLDGQLGDGTYSVVVTNSPYGTNRPEQIVASGVTAISAGDHHTVLIKNDGSLWGMGDNEYGELGDGTYDTTNRPEQIVAGPLGYNRILAEPLSGGSVRLSYLGIAGVNYALDGSSGLTPANWVPRVTNTAVSGGALVFTNTPEPTTNNFWRIRSVP